MTVSVVIPAYRASATLRRAIDSCIAWTRPENIVVVLDGPDRELECAARTTEGVRVVVLGQQRGAPVCRNTGLGLVRTEFVVFLDADDYVEGPLFESAVAAAQITNADFVLGRFCLEYPGGRRVCRDPRELYGVADPAHILKRWLSEAYVPPCAIVWRSVCVRALGGWDESLAKNQDGDLIYRALMSGARPSFCAEGLGVYEQDDNPARITRRINPRTLSSQLAVLEKVRRRRFDLTLDPTPELALAYYSLARLAYTAAADELGEQAERTARALGLCGQPGDKAHALVASLLGLRGKQKLATMVRRAALA